MREPTVGSESHAQSARRWLPPLSLLLLALAPHPARAQDAMSTRNRSFTVDERPFRLHMPPDKAGNPALMPLVILLPGYQTGATTQETYFQMRTETDPRGMVFVAL